MVKSTAMYLDQVFRALADSTRRDILRNAAGGDKTVSDIARPFNMSLAAVSKHLNVLEAAGLITREKRGTARIIRINPKPIAQARAWLAHHEAFWNEKLDALGALLEGEDHERQSENRDDTGLQD